MASANYLFFDEIAALGDAHTCLLSYFYWETLIFSRCFVHELMLILVDVRHFLRSFPQISLSIISICQHFSQHLLMLSSNKIESGKTQWNKIFFDCHFINLCIRKCSLCNEWLIKLILRYTIVFFMKLSINNDILPQIFDEQFS